MEKKIYAKYKLANLININKIVTLHYFEFEKHFKFEGECHDFWELVYVDQGEVLVTAKNKEKRLKQGDMIFHKPNEFHTIRANGVIAANVFIITFVCRSKAMDFFKGKSLKLPVKLKYLIAEIIDAGKKTFHLPFHHPKLFYGVAPGKLEALDSPLIGGQQLIKINLEALLIKIIQQEKIIQNNPGVLLSKEESENKIIADLLKILMDQLYGNINLNEICEKMNYCKTYLGNHFKRNTGYSIMQYYTILKIAEAKKLIREEQYNFTQISDLLCFNNPHYFSYVFKQIAGMTPREYSKSIKLD